MTASPISFLEHYTIQLWASYFNYSEADAISVHNQQGLTLRVKVKLLGLHV